MALSKLNNDSFDDTAVHGRRNRIINGAMQVWQRGTSSTSDGYKTADRYQGSSQNGAATMSQQSFTVGQTDVPGEPQFYYRHNQTTQATDYMPNIQHRIEGVRSLAGQKVTLSVYAKASKSVVLKTYIFQHFGSGGSPSSGVAVENSPTIATLTTSWQRVTYTFDMDSISGKTLGSNGDDYLAVYLQFPTSDTYSVDLALLQIEAGDKATPFEHRSFGEELELCKRYFIRTGEFSYHLLGRWHHDGGTPLASFNLPTTMRGAPGVSVSTAFSSGSGYTGTPTFGDFDPNNFTISSATSRNANDVQYAHNGKLDIDAEL